MLKTLAVTRSTLSAAYQQHAQGNVTELGKVPGTRGELGAGGWMCWLGVGRLRFLWCSALGKIEWLISQYEYYRIESICHSEPV